MGFHYSCAVFQIPYPSVCVCGIGLDYINNQLSDRVFFPPLVIEADSRNQVSAPAWERDGIIIYAKVAVCSMHHHGLHMGESAFREPTQPAVTHPQLCPLSFENQVMCLCT